MFYHKINKPGGAAKYTLINKLVLPQNCAGFPIHGETQPTGTQPCIVVSPHPHHQLKLYIFYTL